MSPQDRKFFAQQIEVAELVLHACPLVLEWLEGEDLERWIRARRSSGQGPLSEGEAVELLSPALDALRRRTGWGWRTEI